MLYGLHLRPPPAMPFITMKEHRAAGSPAELADLADYAMFIKRSPTTDDGSCFILSDDEAPDPSLSWFYCDEYARAPRADPIHCTCKPSCTSAVPTAQAISGRFFYGVRARTRMDGKIALGRPRGLAVLEAKARKPKPRRSLEEASTNRRRMMRLRRDSDRCGMGTHAHASSYRVCICTLSVCAPTVERLLSKVSDALT